MVGGLWFTVYGLQVYLAHKKMQPPRSLQYGDAWGPMVILGAWVFSYERGTPVGRRDSTSEQGGAAGGGCVDHRLAEAHPLIRKRHPIGPYSRTMPMALW